MIVLFLTFIFDFFLARRFIIVKTNF